MSDDKREVGLNSPQAISTRAELYGLVITFVTLAAFSLMARLYVRILAGNQGLEDWLVVAAMVRSQHRLTLETPCLCFHLVHALHQDCAQCNQ